MYIETTLANATSVFESKTICIDDVYISAHVRLARLNKSAVFSTVASFGKYYLQKNAKITMKIGLYNKTW